MLNGKPRAGNIVGFALGTGFILLMNVLLSPYGTMLEDLIGLALFIGIGACVILGWDRLRG